MADKKRERVNVSKVCEALGLFVHYCPECVFDRDTGVTWCDCGKWDENLSEAREKLKPQSKLEAR